MAGGNCGWETGESGPVTWFVNKSSISPCKGQANRHGIDMY